MRLCFQAHLYVLGAGSFPSPLCSSFSRHRSSVRPTLVFVAREQEAKANASAAKALPQLHAPCAANHHWPCEVRAGGMKGAANRGIVEETAAYATQQFWGFLGLFAREV